MLLLLSTITLSIICAVFSSPLCVTKNASCSSLLWENNYTDDACSMRFYNRDSTECKNMSFNYDRQDSKPLGDVIIKPYPNSESKYSDISFKFINISWTFLKMRLLQENVIENKQTCVSRSFTIWENVTVPNEAILEYSCTWYYDYHMGQTFLFEFEMSNGDVFYTKKYRLRIPYYDSLVTKKSEEREVFSYIDITEPLQLKLKIYPLPAIFNVTNYKVQVWRKFGDINNLVDARLIKPHNNIMNFSYPTSNEVLYGAYYFNLSIINDVCSEDMCLHTLTAEVYIPKKSSSLVIGMVGALAIITSFFYGICICNRFCFPNGDSFQTNAQLLLVYIPSTEIHNQIVSALAEILKKLFNLNVMLDVNDIPNTKHKNPLIWSSNAFDEATHVIYIASPKEFTTKPVYRVDTAFMRFIYEEIGRTTPTKEILTITFPYSLHYIPEELKHFKNFDFMKDFHSFIKYLTNKRVNDCKKSFWFRKKCRTYEQDALYMRFLEMISNADENLEAIPKQIEFLRPEIKITNESDDVITSQNPKENDLLIPAKYQFDIEELDLSGNPKTDFQSTEKIDCVKFDINQLNLS